MTTIMSGSTESRTFVNHREQRWLHPMAWWAWAAGLAIAASTTTNPLLLLGVIAVSAFVVERRKPDAPWARSFAFFLRIAVVVVVIRVLAQTIFGSPTGTTLLINLPGIGLPSWLAGVRLGGAVMLEPMLQAVYDGLRLAAIIVAVGAAGSLASPARVLKSVPAALYEVGVSVVVASTFLPQLVADVSRIRTNRRLRGRPEKGVRAVGGAMMPVLHSAMDRSIALAAAMDSRGYGRTTDRSTLHRSMTSLFLLTGIVVIAIGMFFLLGTASDGWSALGLVLVLIGLVGTSASVVLAGQRSTRTRYRPNTWHRSDVATALSGMAVATCFLIAAGTDPSGMAPSTEPAVWPSLPILGVAGLLMAALPAFITPAPPESVT